MAYIISSGEISSGIILNSYDSMTILDGGTANRTAVDFRCSMYVSSGGTANSTTVYEYGSLFVSSGGTATNTTVNKYGYLFVSSGGTATNILWTPCEGQVITCDGAVVTFVSQYSGVYFGSNNRLLSHAAIMEDKAISNTCIMNIMSGGTANNTAVNNGNLYVSSGGAANSTTVSDGSLTVSSGGTANSSFINFNGRLHVSSGGTATNTTVNSGASMCISSGGTANNTMVNEYGYLFVSSGGTANGTTIDYEGSMCVSSGGTATGIIENGGHVYVEDGALTTFVPNTFSGLILSNDATIHSGTTASNTTVTYGGEIYVSSGGTASSTTVTYGGEIYVSSGGTANGTTIDYEGSMCVSSGGTATNTTVNGYGYLFVSSGGTATGIIENRGNVAVEDGANVTFVANTFSGLVLSSSLSATVHSGTTANNTKMSGGRLTVFSGGTANSTTFNSGGRMFVSDGGVADDTIVSGTTTYGGTSYGYLYVASGGTANRTIVNSIGHLYVSCGGTANSTTVNYGGTLYVYSGGTANSTTVYSGGNLTVYSGGTANIIFTPWQGTISAADGATISYIERDANIYYASYRELLSKADIIDSLIISSGRAVVYSEGIINNTTVYSGGSLDISSGGVANITTLNNGGNMYISNGGIANSTTVNSFGSLLIFSGGTANSTIVNSGGRMYISSGGTAVNINVRKGADLSFSMESNTIIQGSYNGRMFELKDGCLSDYTVPSILYVSSGGTASNITVTENTRLYISSGGKLTGKMMFENGAVVCAYPGAILNFDLTQTSAKVAALVNDLSCVDGSPVYTLTVSGTESSGTYSLADGVSVFSSVLSVMNTSGEQLGSLMVGQKLETEQVEYSLKVANGNLSVIVKATETPPIDTIAPTVTNVKADITTPTKQNVTVTASFNDDVGVASSLYRIGENGTWLTYVDGVTISSNTMVFFKATDTAGNESEIVSYTVSNIDKDAPVKPTASASITGQTIEEVLVSAVFSNDSVVKEYSLDGQSWKTYTNGIKFTENGFVFFRGTDAAGNTSEITIFQVANIIKDDPVPPVEEGVFGPDTREDDWLYDKKTKKLNEGVTDSVPVEITSETGEILFDESGSVSHEEKGKTWYNFVGKGKVDNETVVDDTDFVKISLESPARLSFSVEATDATKFTVYSLVAGTDKNGNATHTMKVLQTTALKKDKSTGLYSTTTKALLLERTEDDRDYYISMQSTNQKAESVFYNVSLNEDAEKTFFYSGADDGTNGWLSRNKGKERNDNVAVALGTAINSGTMFVQVDEERTVSHEIAIGKETFTFTNYVGYGDAADYRKITLETGASLSFTVKATDTAKVVICSLVEGTGKKAGTYTMKQLQTSTLKLDKETSLYTIDTKPLLLSLNAEDVEGNAFGEYYISVQSTNAAKGGKAYYYVELNDQKTVFYSDADDGTNGWLYRKSDKARNMDIVRSEGTSLTMGTTNIQIDEEGAVSYTDETGGITYSNFVGFGDDTDYARIELDADATVSFKVNATDSAKFIIYSLVPGKNGYTMKAVQTTTLKLGKDKKPISQTTKALWLAEGTYYIAMQSTNAKSGGAAYYNVSLNQDACSGLPDAILESHDACALTMPESFDMIDDLGVGLMNETNLLSTLSGMGANADIASERIFGESGNVMLASL